MRTTLLLVFLMSFNVNAEQKLTGLWEGFDFDLRSYNSHTLEVNENGEGFYAFTLAGDLSQNEVFSINSSNFVYSDGFYKLVAKNQENITVTVLIAESTLKDLSVITIIRGKENKVMFSFAWKLAFVDGNLQNSRLYEFGRKIYNQRMSAQVN